MMTKRHSMFDPTLVTPALVGTLRKLDPRVQFKNPVMFIVFIGSLLTTGLWVQALGGQGEAPAWFIGVTTLWLWFTVLFANFAEALAEGRSRAQAAALRRAKKFVVAKKLREPRHGATVDLLPGADLRRGNVVLAEAGDMIPADGEVIEGVASTRAPSPASHVKRVAQHKGNALLTAEIGDPIPGEDALDGDRQVFLVGLNHDQERLARGFHVLMYQGIAFVIEDTDVH